MVHSGGSGDKVKPGFSVDIDEIGEQFQTTGDQIRDFIWKATDSIAHAVEDMPDIGVCCRYRRRLGVFFVFGCGMAEYLGPVFFVLVVTSISLPLHAQPKKVPFFPQDPGFDPPPSHFHAI